MNSELVPIPIIFPCLNSPNDDITQASIKDLEYHHHLLTCMGLDSSSKLVIHVGGSYNNKSKSIARFISNYNKLPSYLQNRLVLKNDDKIYTTKDVLDICQELNIPMILDVYHHWCNNNDDIADYLPAIFATWKGEKTVPKIHISSPRDQQNFRSHADNIDLPFFIDFLEKAKIIDQNFNVMIEAKNKDVALFKLMDELKQIPKVKFISQATINY